MTVSFEDPPELPGWLDRELPWRRRMARIQDHRIHFIDEGHHQSPPVLLVHGNPTWCFLWRKVLRKLLPQEVRVVVPDLLGFGLSDKPTHVTDHSLRLHVDLLGELVEALDLRDLTLVGQDWGGPIATGVGARAPARVHGLVLANTAVLKPSRPFRPKAFHRLSHVPGVSDVLFRGLGFPLPVLDRVQGQRDSIGRLEKRAYRWPLRRIQDRAGPLALARMVPNAEDHPSTPLSDEIGAWVEAFDGPAALVWGKRDPILGRALRRHREVLPQATVTETEAGHFLQEEVPDALAEAIGRVAHEPRAFQPRSRAG